MHKKNSEEFPDQEKRQKHFECSIGFTMTVIGSKWRAIILWHIMKKQLVRYGQLKRSIPYISHKVFAQELKALEADGLVQRVAYAEVPPKVEYSLTERGRSLEKVLTELCLWGRNYIRVKKE
ncbi:MAG TPA: winged helix-turn-helix transcriptional regulator [Clostridia bacterium]|nr:winged helix-turn-helix transcriptional regulator [Clostridia bacterium]